MRLGADDGHDGGSCARALMVGWGTVRIIRPSPDDPASEDRRMAQRIDLRDALRVKPGSRVRPRQAGPGGDPRMGQGDGRPRAHPPARAARDAPGPVLGRGAPIRPHRPPGHRRRRQGRHHQQGHGGVQPAGLPRDVVQGPELRGARARLPVADPQGHPAQGRDRHLQSIALRGRARGPRARPRAQGGLVQAVRADQRLRGDPRRQRDDRRQALPLDRSRRAARALPGPLSTTRPSAGSSRWATSRSASAGTTTRPRSTRRSRRPRRTAAPWYVIPANRKWFRNLAVATIVADTIADLKPAYPRVADDVPADLVIE